MAILRDHPYEGSNFLVDMGVYDSSDMRAAFFRVELPEAIVDEIAYRNGNDKTQEARKQPGLAKYGHLVLAARAHRFDRSVGLVEAGT